MLLCQLLRSTGVLGAPNEYFNPQTLRNWGFPDYPEDPEAQIGEILRLGATPNGVYGLKLFSGHFDYVKATRWAERLPALRFIHLTRLDALGQAISHVRAQQTWQWVARLPARGEAAYDFDRINIELVRLLRAQTRWAYYFASNGLPTLHLVYEQFIQAPQATVDAVARFMGVEGPTPIDPSLPTAVVQRDALSQEWRERYLAQARNLAEFH